VIFRETPLVGAFLIEPEIIADDRGAFARLFDEADFAARGLRVHFQQWSLSRNAKTGTLRGMHYSVGAHAETKLVRVTRGRIYDVIIDLRQDSPTHRQWFAVSLDADLGNSLYIPSGMAHGFQTLKDEAEVLYQIHPGYWPEAARGVRWDDPTFCIVWPEVDRRIMSARDREYPDYCP
jgi:dTDP-4-dehydrorhamnose 3,5-epimerase